LESNLGGAVNPYLQVALTVGGAALVQWTIVAFAAGKLNQQVKDLVGWNKRQDDRLDRHEDRLTQHASDIAYIKGKKGLSHGDQA
jgi:membrane-bound lytic murein transglycosylase MltF